jgi:lipoprotein-releasing system permease protein
MNLPSDIFLALRYLRPKRTLISVITLLSIIGPALGVAILIIVTSVMSGFDRDIRQRILSMQAHLQAYPAFYSRDGNGPVIRDPQPVLQEMDRLGIQGAPIIEGPILLQFEDQIQIKYLRGIEPDREGNVTRLQENLVGRYAIKEGEALIGQEMAFAMGLRIGDELLIHSPQKLTRNIEWSEDGTVTVKESEEVYLPEEVKIVGIFSMGVYEYDSSIVFIHIDQAADLFGLDWGTATSVHAKTPDPFDLDDLTATLRARLPGYRMVTWQEQNEQLFGALRVEKNLMLLVLFSIIVVAAFCIAGTLITVVIQKTREVAILKAVGMTGALVARIFLLQGAIIGILGTALGLALGLLVVHFRNQVAAVLAKIMGVEIFPKELYHLSQIPAMIKQSDLLLIFVVAFVLCIAASMLPALYASSLSPARGLQDEN